MPDPVLLGLLQALREGDASAQPALVDYLLERNDPRAEMVRQGKCLREIAELFSATAYLKQIHGRLIDRNMGLVPVDGSKFCYLSRQARYGLAVRQNPPYLAEAVTVAEFPALDRAGIQRFTAETYRLVRARFPKPPRVHYIDVFCLSYSLAVIPDVNPVTADAIRNGKPRRRWRFAGWGFEIPVVFDPISWKLHYFRKAPAYWDAEVEYAVGAMLEETLNPNQSS